jgi:hypothetical protein
MKYATEKEGMRTKMGRERKRRRRKYFGDLAIIRIFAVRIHELGSKGNIN